MEILNLNHLLKIKLLRIKNNNEKLEEVQSKSLNLKTPQQPKLNLKLDFVKEVNNKERSMLSYNSLKYMPKRLSGINLDNQSFPNISTNSSTKLTNNYQINLNEKFNHIIKRLKPESGKIFDDLNRISNFKGIKFRNEYQLKYDLIIGNYEKLKMKNENISEINKYKYNKYWEKIINCVRNQSELLFNSIINLGKEETRALISTMEEHNYFIHKLILILISELNSKEENNNTISKIKRDLENENLINITEKEKLKEIVNNQKFKELYSNRKKVKEQIGKAKLQFLKEKNDYILLINELTKEIQNLYRLLNKNKDYYNKFIKNEKIIKDTSDEQFELKTIYMNEIKKLKDENLIARIYIEKLNQKIEKLKNEVREVKTVEKDIINYKIQIKNLEAQNIKLFENYLMLKEELDSYLYLRKKIKI